MEGKYNVTQLKNQVYYLKRTKKELKQEARELQKGFFELWAQEQRRLEELEAIKKDRGEPSPYDC